MFTNRLCRSAFRSTGIYPYNPDAVLKNLPELNADENRITLVPAPDELPATPPPKQKNLKPSPPTTPYNAIRVKQHVEVVLEEFDSLECQGVELEPGIRERAQQLAKSAHMSMTREAMQIETNRQLRLLNRKKGKSGGEGTGPGSRTELTDKGCRVLTSEEARLRKRRAEEKLEADVQKQQRLEVKRQEKAFEQAMNESPMGGIYEAQAAAEPGESVVFKTMNSLGGSDTSGVFGASVVEVL